MKHYAILTNRKRSIIALIHSIVFALIALISIVRAAQVTPIWLKDSAGSTAITLIIYLIVSSVLVVLFRVSRPARFFVVDEFEFLHEGLLAGAAVEIVVGHTHLATKSFTTILCLYGSNGAKSIFHEN
jgi:hypothetical protein